MTEAVGKVASGNGQVRTSGFPLSTSPLPPSPLGLGLLGLGRWGRNYLKTLLALPECRLVAAADSDEAARAVAAHETGITPCKGIEELLSDSSVEALIIATPDRSHFSLASSALKAGRDVLVEKPMALEPQEAEALAGQAEAGQRVLAVGHTAVHNHEFATLLAAVRSDPRGSMRHATAVRSSSGFADGRSNPILDLCPHDLAMAVLLFGTPVAVRARYDGASVEYEVRFENDALLSGRAEWCQPPHIRRFEVANQWGKGKVEVTEAKGKVESGNGQVRTSEFPFSTSPLSTSPLGRQCLDFIESCRTRRQPLSDGRLGVAVARCLAALSASNADGNAWVPLAGLVHRPSSIVHRSEVA